MLSASSLCYSYNDARVLANISFSAQIGSMLQVRGPNGSGKTTLLKIVAGLLEPDEGEVVWDGVPTSSLASAHRGDFSYVGHKYGLKTQLTALENLAAHAGIAGGDEHMSPAEALARVGLGHKAQARCSDLSTGQLRRVSLARLLINRARLWLLDEPMANLDEEGVSTLTSILKEHLKGGMAVVTAHRGSDWPGLAVQDLGLG